MIIGLDVDDVIFDTSAMLKEVLDKVENSGLEAIKLDVMRGDTKVPGVKDFLQKYLIIAVKNGKPMLGAAEVIRRLRKDGHKIILITARGNKYFPGTQVANEKALRNAGIEYDVLVYDSADKVDACQENGVEVFVDDSPRNCVEVRRELGIPVIGFESDITREGLREAEIKSVDNWVDLEKIILDLAKK